MCFVAVFWKHYLDKNNMNDQTNSATKYGIGAIFCRVAHAVMSTITSKYHLLAIKWIYNGVLIGAPKLHNAGKQKVPLMVVIGSFIVAE